MYNKFLLIKYNRKKNGYEYFWSPKKVHLVTKISIKPDNEHIIESNGTTYTLIIKNAKAIDEDKYRVLVENLLDHADSTA